MPGTVRPVPTPLRIASNPIVDRREELARAIVAIQFERWPALYARYGEGGRERCVEDVGFHLLYLAEAVASDSPALFREYVAWVKILFAGIGIPDEELGESLEILRDVVAGRVEHITAARVRACVGEGLTALPGLPREVPPFVRSDAPLGALARSYLDALLAGDRRRAAVLVMEAAAAGARVPDLYLHVFQPALREIGRLWQTRVITVAHEHFATAATQAIMGQLYPAIFAAERRGLTMVATCVSGEQHEIGIRMVADFFEMAGWDSHYLGANTPADSVARLVRERGAHVLAVSATITAHVGRVAALIAAVRAEPGEPPHVLVGGYPFNLVPDLWRTVGADAFAPSAEEAVVIAERLTGPAVPDRAAGVA
ncbi:cobalamin B12-binding domain protein [Azospirillum formosense]|uniref:Cobalamin B12-binding domain protein n=1 Tax=Azospirillum formosense TaxID=861533 RepID=A0ABX2L2N2_9PROT|nr:cobalamin-dependent protein [Azospirillum formosense]MBY3754963.1 cobalamin B12-binding domain protein [Azospirillum formosense]NUB19440.1 cobalamin B12-binding domain protein [Azospirillum formosense]